MKFDTFPMDQSEAEQSGAAFDLSQLELARQHSTKVLEAIAREITPGMIESEAHEIAEKLFGEAGVTRKWHRTWIRFGQNTLLTYGVPSNPDVVLQKDDIFFLDIGPVWNGYEGDIGNTYVVGSDSEMLRCQRDVRIIYDEVKAEWATKQISGKELMEFAAMKSQERGWEFNLKGAAGHRLSDFPHTLHYKGTIANLPFKPSRGLWVLEIQIRHPEKPFGAFYEDLLL